MVRALTGLVAVTAVTLGCAGWWVQTLPVLWYRIGTSMTALRALYTLPPEHVEAFLRSYDLFELESVTGKNNEAQNTVNYYQVVNHLCAVGEVEKMYIPPVMDSTAGVFGNQMLWEERGMADKIDIKPNASVLDMGCGRGRIAHHVATYTGARVTGLNIDPGQIKMAEDYARTTEMLGKQLNFVQGNYNDPFPFKDESFDAIYQVQVLTYAIDLVKVFREWYRVLKPGAKVSSLDWVQLEAYNEKDPHHKEILRKVKALIGAVWTPKPQEFVDAFEKAGFKVLFSGEASEGGHQGPLIGKAKVFFEPLHYVIALMVKMYLIPAHFETLFERLTRDGAAFVEGDELGLFTTSWQIIAQKPFGK
mmetsp:Transcript_10659/g.23880  ORF Transcript_10659/g.23880 Transcript_10659/m.23880 type:complete len:362 (-) Transcript_10659:353-1438(-)